MQITQILLVIFTLLLPSLSWDPLIATSPSTQTLSLFHTLSSLNRNFFISGQTTDYYDTLSSSLHIHPVIRGFDMQNYSPHNPWFNWQPVDDGTVGKAIEWYKGTGRKGIVSFQWHWFSPKGGQLRTSTFYTNYTDFDVRKAVVEGSEEYGLTVRDIDAIAVQLKRLKAEKIPILWRPLHQAGGGWFWWGAKGSAPALSLLKLIFHRLNTHHSLNNLIWVWSTPQASWYPGPHLLDIIGYDSYPGSYNYDCNLKMFMQLRGLVNATKMVAMTENGPMPDWEKCWKDGAMWGYWMGWSKLTEEQNSAQHIKAMYGSAKVKTIENM